MARNRLARILLPGNALATFGEIAVLIGRRRGDATSHRNDRALRLRRMAMCGVIVAAILCLLPLTGASAEGEDPCDYISLEIADGSWHFKEPGQSFTLKLSIRNDSPGPFENIHLLFRRFGRNDLVTYGKTTFSGWKYEDNSEPTPLWENDASDETENAIKNVEWVGIPDVPAGRTFVANTEWRIIDDARRGEWIVLDVNFEGDVTEAGGTTERITCVASKQINIQPHPGITPVLVPVPNLTFDDDTPAPGQIVTITALLRNPGDVIQTDVISQFTQSSEGEESWLEPVSGTTAQGFIEYALHQYHYMESVSNDVFAIGGSWTILELNPQMLYAIRFDARVSLDAEIGRVVTPSVCVTGYEGLIDPRERTNCDELSLVIAPAQSQPEIYIDVSYEYRKAEGPVILTTTVHNHGPDLLADAVLRLELPRTVIHVPGTGALSYGSYKGSDARLLSDASIVNGIPLPTIESGGKVNVEFHIEPSSIWFGPLQRIVGKLYQEGQIITVATGKYQGYRSPGSITLTVSAPEAIEPGTELSYRVLVKTNGRTSIENAFLVVTLPEGLDVQGTVRAQINERISQITSGWRTRSIDAPPRNWIIDGYAVPTLESGQELVIRFNVKLPPDLDVGTVLLTSAKVVDQSMDPFVSAEGNATTTIEYADATREDVSPFNNFRKATEWIALEVVTIVGTLVIATLIGAFIYQNRRRYMGRLRDVGGIALDTLLGPKPRKPGKTSGRLFDSIPLGLVATFGIGVIFWFADSQWHHRLALIGIGVVVYIVLGVVWAWLLGLLRNPNDAAPPSSGGDEAEDLDQQEKD